MKNKIIIISLCLMLTCSFTYFVDLAEASNGLQPFDYWYNMNRNSFGITELKKVNDTYFQNWFNENTKSKLEGQNPINLTWMNATDYLLQTYDYNHTNKYFKITWNFTSPKNWRYRLSYAINADVIEYINKSTYTILLNFSVGNNDVYHIYFNLSDLKQKIENGSLIEKHGFKDIGNKTFFWFRLTTKNPIKKGRNFILDPIFGHTGEYGSAQAFDNSVILGIFSCPKDCTADNITLRIKMSAGADDHAFKVCIYYRSNWSLVGNSSEYIYTLNDNTWRWETYNFEGTPKLKHGVVYGLGAYINGSAGAFYIDWVYKHDYETYIDFENYDAQNGIFDDPLTGTSLFKGQPVVLCVYISYTIRIGGIISYWTLQNSFLYEAGPNTNYDNIGGIHVQTRNANRNKRTVIQFSNDNFSEIPSNAIIRSAIVNLYYFDKSGNNPVGRVHNIHSINISWHDNTTTWNDRRLATAWVTPGGMYNHTLIDSNTVPAGFGWVDWNVTTYIADVINNGTANYGFLIKDNAESSGINYKVVYYDSTNFTLKGVLDIIFILPEDAPIIVSVWPANNTIDLCPCCLPVNVTVVQANGTLMDISYELNETGVWLQYSTIFDDVPNGSYAMLVCDFNKFSYNYWIRITVSTPAGANITVLKYTTIDDINCSAANVTGVTEDWVDERYLSGPFDFSPEFMLFFLWLFIFYLWWKSETEDMTFLWAILFVPYSFIFAATTLLLYNTSWIIQMVFIAFSLIVLSYTIDERRRRRK